MGGSQPLHCGHYLPEAEWLQRVATGHWVDVIKFEQSCDHVLMNGSKSDQHPSDAANTLEVSPNDARRSHVHPAPTMANEPAATTTQL